MVPKLCLSLYLYKQHGCNVIWHMTYEINISTQRVRLCMMCNRQTRMAAGSGEDRYLVLLGDVLLVILLHLPELGLQATELDLHLLHVLQVPLGPLVQHLDGLGHVLDLK